jgi:alpha,alpha-trehalase
MIQREPPSAIWQDLFTAVQTQAIFPDSKTFVDAVPLRAPDDILRDYRHLLPLSDQNLRDFVSRNFVVPTKEKRHNARPYPGALAGADP